MRLTFYTDYALRLLIYLAIKPDGLANVSEVAAAYGISRAHLVKVAHELRRAGYIRTARGRGGGMRLAQAPEAVRVGDVIRRTEPDMALVPCFEPLCVPCPIIPACGLVGVMHEARDAFMAVADRYTLEHLVQRRGELATLLARDARSVPLRARSQNRSAGRGE